MPLSFKERQKILKNSNTLDLHPVRSFSHELESDEIVTIIMPKFSSKFASKYISPKLKSSVFKIKLDRLGSAVWMQIDGKKNVQAIMNNLEARLGEEIQPVSERVTKFIFQLYEQRLISFNELK